MTPNRKKRPPEENEPQQGFLESLVRKGGDFFGSILDSIQEVIAPPVPETDPIDKPKSPPKVPAVTNISHTETPRLVTCLDMKAWPFMFSRSFTVDYGAVAAPEFIHKGGAARELIHACENFGDIGDAAIHMNCFHPNVGDFDLIVRVVTGTERMLGKESDAVLHDNVGRPIRIMEGVAFQGRLTPEQLQFTKNQLDAAHHPLEPHFRKFWKGDFNRPAVASTDAFTLPPAAGEFIKLHNRFTPNARPRLNAEPPTLPALKTLKEPPSAGFHRPSGPSKGGLNTTAVFLVVTGVAVGAILAYRHFTKAKNPQESFAQRVSSPDSSSASRSI